MSGRLSVQTAHPAAEFYTIHPLTYGRRGYEVTITLMPTGKFKHAHIKLYIECSSAQTFSDSRTNTSTESYSATQIKVNCIYFDVLHVQGRF